MCNKRLKLEHTAHNKSSYALHMIRSKTGLHSTTYSIVIFVHEERLAMPCENNKIMDHQKSHLFFNYFLYKLQILIIKTIFANTASLDLGFL